VSMSLHQTSFCFVCTHLTSGHKEGDELRRNYDVADILRRTTFPRLLKVAGAQLPETIMAHESVQISLKHVCIVVDDCALCYLMLFSKYIIYSWC
jgi:hypothetical protein